MVSILLLLLFQGVIIFKAVQVKPYKLGDYDYPDFGDAIGWLQVAATTLIIPGWLIGYYCYKGGASVSRVISLVLDLYNV